MTHKEKQLIRKWYKINQPLYRKYKISKRDSLYLAKCSEILFFSKKFNTTEENEFRTLALYSLGYGYVSYDKIMVEHVLFYCEQYLKPLMRQVNNVQYLSIMDKEGIIIRKILTYDERIRFKSFEKNYVPS